MAGWLGRTLNGCRLAVGHAGWLTLEKESYTMTTTTTDTKQIKRIYVHIERVVEASTGWSYIERVYSSFWVKGFECVRETTYGMPITNDREAFEAVQSSLEFMEEEGYAWGEAEVQVVQQTRTTCEGSYWDVIGRRI